MNDAEKEKYALHVLKVAFVRHLSEAVGSIENKPPMELVAWSQALLELEQEMRQQLLKTPDEPN